MSLISNLFLTCRLNSSSMIERMGDFLLTPARRLFGGTNLLYLQDRSIHVIKPPITSTPSNLRTQITADIIDAIILPCAAIGSLMKLVCLHDSNYRAFCVQKIPQDKECHPKLFEMFQHVSSTANFISRDHAERLTFKPLDLFECCCAASGAFDRLNSPRRNNLEHAVVKHLVNHNPDQSKPLRLLSMGSGGLMCDFLIIEKLILAGFKNIAIDCIEPLGIPEDRVRRIREFFSSYPDISFEIHTYNNMNLLPVSRINHEPVTEQKYSCVLAIDYDSLTDTMELFDASKDLIKAYRLLDEQGCMGLGYSNDDLLVGPQMNPVTLTSYTPLMTRFINDFQRTLAKKENLTIALRGWDFAGSTAVLMLALAIMKEGDIKESNKPYSQISVVCLPEVNMQQVKREEAKFKNMMESLFPNTQISIAYEKVSKFDLLFTGAFAQKDLEEMYHPFLTETSITYLVTSGATGFLYRQIGTNIGKTLVYPKLAMFS